MLISVVLVVVQRLRGVRMRCSSSRDKIWGLSSYEIPFVLARSLNSSRPPPSFRIVPDHSSRIVSTDVQKICDVLSGRAVVVKS